MKHITDLSLPIDNAMRGVAISSAKRLEEDGWNATTLSLYSHCGTHMDAPCHFLTDGADLEQQDLAVCVGQAKVFDLTPIEPRALITPQSLGSAADSIGRGDRILLRTDWYRRHGIAAYRDELPRISRELAQWLVDRQVALLGVEPPSVADVNNSQELTEVHHILMRGGVTIVEGLARLDQLTAQSVEFIAIPLRIPGGDGSPVRAIAIEERGDE